jgi:inosine-uridine nucleoside N-ribohydrolase
VKEGNVSRNGTLGVVRTGNEHTTIVCDTDVGSDADDYLALAYLANAASLKLVSTSYGPVTTRARAVGTLFRAMDVHIPVVPGARDVMTPGKPIWLTGDEAYLVDPTMPVDERSLLDAYLELDSFTLLAIGPLTNVALLVQHPAFVERCDRIVIMGGTTHRQIIEREHNFHADPIATKIVMESPIPKVLIPLELTAPITMTDEHYGMFRDADLGYAKLLYEWVAKWRTTTAWTVTYPDRVEMVDHVPPFYGNIHWHDPIAAAFITHPELFTTETVQAHVDDEGGLVLGTGPSLELCTDMDQRVIDVIAATILQRELIGQ